MIPSSCRNERSPLLCNLQIVDETIIPSSVKRSLEDATSQTAKRILNSDSEQQHSTPNDEAIKDHRNELLVSMCRGFNERKPFLKNIPYFDLRRLIVEKKDCLRFVNDNGHTWVYFLKTLPGIILKDCKRAESLGKPSGIKRLQQMQDVRAELDRLNCFHLIIPKAMPCLGILIEERLPINVDQDHNLTLYTSKPRLFDEAVREFTRLFSKIYISDITSNFNYSQGNYGGSEIVRYDNFPLYVTSKEGKEMGNIGFIDLEHTVMKPQLNCLDTLARAFPFHIEIIREEAAKYDIAINEESFQAAAEKGNDQLNRFLRYRYLVTHSPF